MEYTSSFESRIGTFQSESLSFQRPCRRGLNSFRRVGKLQEQHVSFLHLSHNFALDLDQNWNTFGLHKVTSDKHARE
jgi:hypothetical protein